MAKIEGTQTIPSELRTLYEGTLTPALPDGTVRARFPFSLPAFKKNGRKVTEAQRAQRDRFLQAHAQFKNLDSAERQRWYDARPIWNSLLWYYNYFMLSALNGVLGAINPGACVIRSIQNARLSVPATGAWFTFATTVLVEKCVIMLWGAAYKKTSAIWNEYAIAIGTEGQENTAEWYATAVGGWPVYPVWDSLNTDKIWIGWASTPDTAAEIAVQVIEYI